jgi:hypothetical protein
VPNFAKSRKRCAFATPQSSTKAELSALVLGINAIPAGQWSGFDVRLYPDRALAGERQIQSSTEINILRVVL